MNEPAEILHRWGKLIGITEDVPEERWAENFTAIMDAIEADARRGARLMLPSDC